MELTISNMTSCEVQQNLYNPTLIAIRKSCQISKNVGLLRYVILHRKVFVVYKTMLDYKDILDYGGVRLEWFQCMQSMASPSDAHYHISCYTLILH